MYYFFILLAFIQIGFSQATLDSSKIQSFSNFRNIDEAIFSRNFNPSETVIFIDLDGTTLIGGEGRGKAKILDPLISGYIKHWQDEGFSIKFLTARNEKDRSVTEEDLENIGFMRADSTLNPIPLLMTSHREKGAWLLENQKELRGKYGTFTNVVLIDDNKQELNSVKQNICTKNSCLLVHFNYDTKSSLKNLDRYRQAHAFAEASTDSSASILIYAIDPNDGKTKILLGKRDDTATWCNLGGKADKGDGTLYGAAIREAREESMGLYDFRVSEIVNEPSHDLIRDENGVKIHRMYLKKGDYIPSEIMRQKLAEQKVSTSKEYTDFAWVDVQEFYEAVENTQNSGVVDGKEVYADLFIMLRQIPVKEWLKALSLNEHVKRIHTQGSINSRLEFEKIKFEVGEPGRLRRIITKETTGIYPSAAPDPKADNRQKLNDITTTRMDLLTELRERKNKALVQIKLIPEDPGTGEADGLAERKKTMEGVAKDFEKIRTEAKSVASQTAIADQTATDAYLKHVLGDEYVSDDDQGNVYRILTLHQASYAEEFLDTSNQCEGSFRCAILTAIKKEREMKNWFVFYHTLRSNMAFFYDVLSEFRNVLKLRNNGAIHTLRSVDGSFSKFASLDDFFEKAVHNGELAQGLDTKKAFSNFALAVNFHLFGSGNTHNESTIDMFYKNLSVQPPNAFGLLELFLVQFHANIDRYEKLFNKYFGNGNHLLQIFVNPDSIDDFVFISRAFGELVEVTPSSVDTIAQYKSQKETHLPSLFLKKFRVKIGEISNKDSLQARIFLKPDIMSDPSKVRIVRYSKTQRDEAKYYQELKELVREDISKWLSLNVGLPDNTMENPVSEDFSSQKIPYSLTPLQRVYRHIGGTKIKYEDPFPKEKLKQLIEGFKGSVFVVEKNLYEFKVMLEDFWTLGRSIDSFEFFVSKINEWYEKAQGYMEKMVDFLNYHKHSQDPDDIRMIQKCYKQLDNLLNLDVKTIREIIDEFTTYYELDESNESKWNEKLKDSAPLLSHNDELPKKQEEIRSALKKSLENFRTIHNLQ